MLAFYSSRILFTFVTKIIMENSNENSFSVYRYVKTNWKNILIFALIIVIIFIVIWNRVSNAKTERLWDAKFKALTSNAVAFSENKDKYYLELVTHSFSLALISEIGRGNLENAEQYATSLIKKDTRVQEVVVSGSDNEIVISTNKVHEGRSLTDYFPFNYLNLKGVSIVKQEKEDQLYCISPLYVLNEQKGILVIKYKPEVFIPVEPKN